MRRSAPGTREFIADLRAGKYGKVKVARGLCYKPRNSIGKVSGPQAVPDHIDYDLWAGPREAAAVMRKQFHYDWHWQWPFGNGDLPDQRRGVLAFQRQGQEPRLRQRQGLHRGLGAL